MVFFMLTYHPKTKHVSLIWSALYVSFFGICFEIGHPFSPFFPLFLEIGQGFHASPRRRDPE